MMHPEWMFPEADPHLLVAKHEAARKGQKFKQEQEKKMDEVRLEEEKKMDEVRGRKKDG
jgi:hypothetical protein